MIFSSLSVLTPTHMALLSLWFAQFEYSLPSADQCTTVSSEYSGSASKAGNLTCEKWPLDYMGLYPDQKMKPEWSMLSSRVLAEMVDGFWETQSHNHCRALDNTVDNVAEQDLFQFCMVNQTSSEFANCTQLERCEFNSCPPGYFTCLSGEVYSEGQRLQSST